MLIWLLLFLLFSIALIYPYTIYPLILKLASKRTINRSSNDKSVSLLFCAYNEEKSVGDKIANLKELKSQNSQLEILAFDDGSSDGTYEILSSVPELLTVIQGPGRNGKAFGMKILAERATGEILLFTDANVLVDIAALDRLRSYFSDPEVGGICGRLIYTGSDNSSTAEVGGAYWRMEEAIKTLESRSGNVMGADGSIFAIRSSLYPNFPDTVLDDLTVSMEVVFQGFRLAKADDVIAYEKLVTSRNDEFARKIRIAARAFHTHMFLKNRLAKMGLFDRFKYASHKLLRWWGGVFLVLATFSLTIFLWLLEPLFAIGAVAIGGMLFALSLRIRLGPISASSEVVLALISTLLGVSKAVSGQTYVIWSPPGSR